MSNEKERDKVSRAPGLKRLALIGAMRHGNKAQRYKDRANKGSCTARRRHAQT